MPPEVIGPLQAIAGFRLVTTDIARLAGFYEALGFTAGKPSPIDIAEMAVLGLAGPGTRLALTLGESRIELDAFESAGRPYPRDTDAASTRFQHFALVTDDADVAWRRAVEAGATPISRSGPVRLPASSGGVTAVKFRDPDGHPLEFLCFPPGSETRWYGRGILGIDHSAISVADVDAAVRFYKALGLIEGDRTLNEGPAQVALDGLDDARVDVVPLKPPRKPPHLELLGYRRPTSRRADAVAANDVVATRIVWRADRDGVFRDPDGHLHQTVAG